MEHPGTFLACVLLAGATSAQAEDRIYKATLVGHEEVPAVITAAGGSFRARLAEDGSWLEYELDYDGLSNVSMAHIHIGQAGANGGVSAWLCSNVASSPPGVQACPASPAHISGVIRASDVVGPVSQGVSPGDFAKLVAALRSGLAYANVHTATSPGGEIRSQLDHSGHN